MAEQTIRLTDYEHAMATLRRAWIDQGLTLAEIGEQAGCHLNRVSEALAGRGEIRSRRLFALAGALGYDLALIPREDA